MSIIRSNIARQLLAEGGAPRASFRNGGARTDANTMSGSGAAFDDGFDTGEEFGRDTYSDQLSDIQESNITGNTFSNIGDVSGSDLRNISIRSDGRSDAGSIFDYTPINLLRRADEKFIGPFRDKSNLARRTEFLRRQGLIGPGEEELPVQFQDSFLKSEAGLDMLRGMGYTTIQDMINKGEGGDNDSMIKLRAPITEKIDEEPKLSDIQNLIRFRGAAFGNGGITGTDMAIKESLEAFKRYQDAGGKLGYREFIALGKEGVSKFFSDGGEVRQKFGLGGLGKVFKKAKKAVSKVFKSPVGKVALLAGLNYAPALFGKQTVLQGLGGNKMFKDLILKDASKKFAFSNIKPFAGITAASLAAGALSKQDEEEEETLPEVARSDPEFANLINYMGGSARFASADGGDIDEAPMKMAGYGYNDAMSDTYDSYLDMKKKGLIPPTMNFDEFLQEVVPEMSKKQGIERAQAAGGGVMNPNDEMLNLGGNEMDLRGGGFVPLGEYEKKDDVPARLSKNEFVFTADAVRAAGGGSVDRGADLMYKTMKQLENKVV